MRLARLHAVDNALVVGFDVLLGVVLVAQPPCDVGKMLFDAVEQENILLLVASLEEVGFFPDCYNYISKLVLLHLLKGLYTSGCGIDWSLKARQHFLLLM